MAAGRLLYGGQGILTLLWQIFGQKIVQQKTELKYRNFYRKNSGGQFSVHRLKNIFMQIKIVCSQPFDFNNMR